MVSIRRLAAKEENCAFRTFTPTLLQQQASWPPLPLETLSLTSNPRQVPEILAMSFPPNHIPKGPPMPFQAALSHPLVQSRAASVESCLASSRLRSPCSTPEPGLRPGEGEQASSRSFLRFLAQYAWLLFLFSAMFHEQGWGDGSALKCFPCKPQGLSAMPRPHVKITMWKLATEQTQY